jgi:signal transduction histidine kinase
LSIHLSVAGAEAPLRPWSPRWLVPVLGLFYLWCVPLGPYTRMGAWSPGAGWPGPLLAARAAQLALLAGAAYVAVLRFPFGAVGRTRWRNTALLLVLGFAAAGAVAAVEAWARGSAGAPAPDARGLAQDTLVLFAMFTARGHILQVRGRLHRGEAAAVRWKANANEAELRMLRREMNPHFVFNALQSVQALIVRDSRTAARAVVRLGDVLREALRRSETQEVTLAHEMEVLRPFLEFEEMRLNGAPLAVEWAVSDEALAAWVPHLVLQPLLENAVKHGIAPRGGGHLRVHAARRGEWLEIEVVDDGAGLRGDGSPGEEGAGIGLANTRRRLQAMYGDAHSFQLSAWPGGTVATLRIPFHTAPLSPARPALSA